MSTILYAYEKLQASILWGMKNVILDMSYLQEQIPHINEASFFILGTSYWHSLSTPLVTILILCLPAGLCLILSHERKWRKLHLFLLVFFVFAAINGFSFAPEPFLPEVSQTNPIIMTLTTLLFGLVALGIVGALLSKLSTHISDHKLKEVNDQLNIEIQERKKAEDSLKEHRENLEKLIQERTFELENTTKRLREEINEHKEAQNQINLQTSLLEQVNSAIIATDLHHNITYWNKCAERLFGWTSSQVLGKPAIEVLIRDEHRRTGKKFVSKLSRKESWAGDFTIPHRLGKKIPVELSCSALLDSEGRKIGTTCVAIDVTNQVRSERKLQREKEKAIKQAHAKQNFLATMSHEIRTPLNVVIGMTRLLKDAEPTQQQQEYLKSLEFSANHLLTIINDILDLAKIDAGKIKLEKINFDVNSVIEGVRKAFSNRAQEKNIDLRVDLDENLPTQLLGDQVRLTQILNNLVSNALKFTNEGFITIRLRVMQAHRQSIKLLFEVSDSGIGIHEDKLGQIFENFTQAQEDTTRKYGGTGLGLTICKKLVDLQQGQISVKSKEGIGSTFSFELEYEIDQTAQTEDTLQIIEKANYSLDNVQLLLVEDNHANRIVASNFLSRMGVKVYFAENGEQAVSIVQQKKFDIILMDLQMPIMNGYDATRAIRQLGEEYQQIPIIALTADVVSDVRKRVHSSGMDDYLSKPFKPEELNNAIAKNLKLSIEVPVAGSKDEEDNVMTLCQILNDYSDDTEFVQTLLSSLRTSFQHLSQQIKETTEKRDTYTLRRIMHKLQPSIKMLENQELYQKLDMLKQVLTQDEINDTEIRLLLEDIKRTSNESVKYINTLHEKVVSSGAPA